MFGFAFVAICIIALFGIFKKGKGSRFSNAGDGTNRHFLNTNGYSTFQNNDGLMHHNYHHHHQQHFQNDTGMNHSHHNIPDSSQSFPDNSSDFSSDTSDSFSSDTSSADSSSGPSSAD